MQKESILERMVTGLQRDGEFNSSQLWYICDKQRYCTFRLQLCCQMESVFTYPTSVSNHILHLRRCLDLHMDGLRLCQLIVAYHIMTLRQCHSQKPSPAKIHTKFA
jgi:hypothetical protein